MKIPENVGFDALLDMAEQYGLSEHQIFLATAKQYCDEARLIAVMEASVAAEGLTVSKSYVKGTENTMPHPLIPLICKHRDSATKCLTLLASIIEKQGTPPVRETKLAAFLKSYDET